MPIKPENEKLYPGGSTRSPEWLAIRESILVRAGGKCEECGAPNRTVVLRDNQGRWDFRRHNIDCREVLIVLTIAHLDHDPGNSSDDNLRAWCQQCHNRYDQLHRQKNARVTRRKRLAAADMFEAAP